jgi:hypothetical protein
MSKSQVPTPIMSRRQHFRQLLENIRHHRKASRTIPPYPKKNIIPRPLIHWNVGSHPYHREVQKRNNDNLLKNWEEDVAKEEINYLERVRVWKIKAHIIRKRFCKNEELLLNQLHIKKLDVDVLRKEKEQQEVADTVIQINSKNQEHYDEYTEDEIV